MDYLFLTNFLMPRVQKIESRTACPDTMKMEEARPHQKRVSSGPMQMPDWILKGTTFPMTDGKSYA